MQVNQPLGIILMMLYSSIMVINSSRKEMVLNKFTALLPGVMSAITFLIMLALIRLSEPVMPMIGIAIGVVVGFLMVRGHTVYEKDGVIYAKRTLFYILIWALSMLFTQGSTLANMREITDFGFLLNGFSTAMMIVLSVFLFLKTSKTNASRRAVSKATVLFVLGVIVPAFSQTAWAYTIEGPMTEEKMKKTARYVFQDIISKYEVTQKTQIGAGPTLGGNGFQTWWEVNKKYPNFYQRRGQAKTSMYHARITVKLFYKRSPGVDNEDLQYRINSCFKEQIGKPFRAMGRSIIILNRDPIELTNGGKGHACFKDSRSPVSKNDPNKKYKYKDIVTSLNSYWIYKDWSIAVTHSDNQYNPGSLLGQNYKEILLNTIYQAQQRIKTIQVTSVASSPPVSQSQPSSTDSSTSSQPDTHSTTHSDFEFSDDEEAAGVLLAVLLLLTGVGMNAATTAVTSGALTATQEAVNANISEGTDDSLPSEDEDDHTLLDPDFGDPLIVHDGFYEGGKPGQVWYDDQWLDKDEAIQKIGVRQQEIDQENREHEKYLEEFQKQNDQEWEQKMAERDQRLKDEGNIYDTDQDAWVKDQNYTPPRTDLEEFYERIDYIDEHRHERSDEEQEAIDRIMERTGYKDSTISEDELSTEDLKTIKKLSHIVLDKENAQTIGDEARDWGNRVERYEKLAEGLKKVGKMSADVLEKHYTKDWTKGGITEFVYSVAGNHDKDIWDNLEESGLSTLKTVSGNLTGDLSKDSAGWRVFNNAAWAGGEEAYKGGDAKNIAQAALENVLIGEGKEWLGGAVKDEDVENKIAEILKKPKGVLKSEVTIGKLSRLGQDSLNRFSTSSSMLDAIKTD